MPVSTAVMLPKNVRPTHYGLTLAPDLETFTFAGDVSIHLDVLEPTDTIVLNTSELEIKSSTLRLSDGSILTPAEVVLSKEDETTTFRFESVLSSGPATIGIQFTGELNDKLRGFYRSKYTDNSGRDRYLATTQFEATDARRAFPCWDEPSLKATFQVTLIVPSDLVAVSNTSIVRHTEENMRQRRVEFANTPVMSTYLLAFIVGDLKSIEQRASCGTLVRVWTTPGKERHGEFALEVSVQLLDYFNDYFGIPYPLEKLDHIAIPDFAAGAMENWGAITYRETALLVHPDHSSAETREIVASIVSHEMAHMWFGDLVTMAWWNDLWLNESFASWMGDKAVDNIFPEWQVWTQFVSQDTNQALSLDGLRHSHPIEQKVNNPSEIGQLFDAISYSKGGSVLRMLEDFIGAETFRKGLQQYLRQHQYRNATTRDLWDSLGEASGQPVAQMMDSWVQQTGYPVLEVSAEKTTSGLKMSVGQNRFVYEHLTDPDAMDDALWRVPFKTRTSDNDQTESILVSQRQITIDIATTGKDDWVKVNPDQTGFYRVNYTEKGWEDLRAAVERAEVSPTDRLGLQNDAYALSRAGYIPVTQFLNLAKAYSNETEYPVWSDLSTNIGSFYSLINDQPYHDAFAQYVVDVFLPAGMRAGWDVQPGERHLDALLRSTLLSGLGHYGDPATLEEASRRFTLFVEEPGSVHPDIHDVVLGLAARQGGQATFDTQWDQYLNAHTEEGKLRFLRAMAQINNTALLNEYLRRSLTSDVRVHNTIGMVVSAASNRLGKDIAWQFLKENWEEFDRRYGEGGFGLMRLVSVTQRFNTQQMYDEVQEFFDGHPVPAAERTIKQSLERIRLNIAWLNRNSCELSDFFASHK